MWLGHLQAGANPLPTLPRVFPKPRRQGKGIFSLPIFPRKAKKKIDGKELPSPKKRGRTPLKILSPTSEKPWQPRRVFARRQRSGGCSRLPLTSAAASARRGCHEAPRPPLLAGAERGLGPPRGVIILQPPRTPSARGSPGISLLVSPRFEEIRGFYSASNSPRCRVRRCCESIAPPPR